MCKNNDDKIKINEVFYSFQGESSLMGCPTVFIRLTGCNLKCKTCDTKYSFKNGNLVSIKELLKLIKQHRNKNICITGGEPLLQLNNLIKLIKKLNKKLISIETNGSLPINKIPVGVKRIIDVKTPSSGEAKSFDLNNLKYLNKDDEIKFVVSNKKDFLFAESFIKKHKLNKKVLNILMSPNLDKKSLANKLIAWILLSSHNYRFQPQLHKLIKEKPVYLFKSI